MTCKNCNTQDNVKKVGGSLYCGDCISKSRKAYYDKKKNAVFEHYGGVCTCCGESEYCFLSIDHVKNDGKNHRWPNGNRVTGVHLYQKIIVANFPSFYQIHCMNCNFGKRMNNGVCPHKMV